MVHNESMKYGLKSLPTKVARSRVMGSTRVQLYSPLIISCFCIEILQRYLFLLLGSLAILGNYQ